MPNNQDTVKLLPYGYMLQHKALGPKTKDAPHEVKWVITRQNGKPLGYVKSKVVDVFTAAMNAPTPREQELEAQNKALWELVKELREAIEDCLANTAERAELGYDAETTIDEEDGTVYYPWGNSQNARLHAAIQKAKEVKV